VATRDVFSEEELQRLREFPEINRAELIRYFTLYYSRGFSFSSGSRTEGDVATRIEDY